MIYIPAILYLAIGFSLMRRAYVAIYTWDGGEKDEKGAYFMMAGVAAMLWPLWPFVVILLLLYRFITAPTPTEQRQTTNQHATLDRLTTIKAQKMCELPVSAEDDEFYRRWKRYQ